MSGTQTETEKRRAVEDDLDPVRTARAIGAVVGRDERQAFYMLENGLLPGTKIGNLWVSDRRKLRAAILGEAQ